MKIFYSCEYCGEPIDSIEVDEVDEAKLGFDCLTGQERQAIIKVDSMTNTMYVQSLCDDCIQRLGMTDEAFTVAASTVLRPYWLH